MSKLLIYVWQIHRLSEAAVIVLLIKVLLVNTCYVLVDVLIAVRLHYRLSEVAVILYIISYITCQLNLPLTVWSGCDFSWILLHRHICCVQFYHCVLIFHILYASIVLFSDTCYVGLVPAVVWMATHPTRWDFSTLYTTCSWDLQVCMYWLERICGFVNYKVDSAGRSCVEIQYVWLNY